MYDDPFLPSSVAVFIGILLGVAGFGIVYSGFIAPHQINPNDLGKIMCAQKDLDYDSTKLNLIYLPNGGGLDLQNSKIKINCEQNNNYNTITIQAKTNNYENINNLITTTKQLVNEGGN